MKLELTDAELKEAVAGYVAGTIGLDLVHNDLKIVFSSTRYEGTIAKLETTPKAGVKLAAASAPATIPGFSDGTDVVIDPTAKDAPALAEAVIDPADAAVAAQADPVQETTAAAEVKTEAKAEPAAAEGAEAAPAEAAAEATNAPAAEAAAPKKSTATLFGKPAAAA